MNIAWYARDGHLDLFPRISQKLGEIGMVFRSFYLCHSEFEERHLREHYGIQDIKVLSRYLEKHDKEFDISTSTIRQIEAKYDTLPLVRALWSEMFQQRLSEPRLVRHMVSHFRFWETFLKRNNIDVLVTERPSILSTCVAWLVCQRLGVRFLAFIGIPLGDRLVISSSWQGHFDGLEDAFLNSSPDIASSNYKKTMEYLEMMKVRPQKTNEALINMECARNVPGPLKKIKALGQWHEIPTKLRLNQQQAKYYIYKSNKQRFVNWLRLYLNSWLYNGAHVFDDVSSARKERYFLMPLHRLEEWSNYAFMGLGFSDQLGLVGQVSQCLPPGAWLYVKEHTGGFGEKPLSFYRQLKSCRQVHILSPYEDTFSLISGAEAIVTLGSTMGFEAILMGKPVILLGEPWYRNLPGVYKAERPETIALLMQKASHLMVPTDEEKLRMVYTLLDISFKGVSNVLRGSLGPENISRLTKILHRYIDKSNNKKQNISVQLQ